MQQGGGIHHGERGMEGVGGIPSAYKTVSHNTMLTTIKKKVAFTLCNIDDIL